VKGDFKQMKIYTVKLIMAIIGIFFFSSLVYSRTGIFSERISSPDRRILVNFYIEDGSPYYNVSKDGKELIKKSLLGVVFKGLGDLSANLEVISKYSDRHSSEWITSWGQSSVIEDRHNRLVVTLRSVVAPLLVMGIEFKVYNDGIGFRYFWPSQHGLEYFEITDEKTEFNLDVEDRMWWIPAFKGNRYEFLYKRNYIGNLDEVIHTPATIEQHDGFALSIHEANLEDYSSMTLRTFKNGRVECQLVPWSDGVMVKANTPHSSPWRTIQIADNWTGLIESNLILNLNNPNQLGDVSGWVYPGKYVGIWWGMHLGIFSWGSGDRHGATTENVIRYIDFAAENGFSGVLVEGWNVGWDGDWYENGQSFNFVTPYPDYNIELLSQYAAAKGVKIIGHHETGAAVSNYERQLDDAFTYLKRHNIDAVKTGYVGTRLDKREWHHGQFGVRHYRKVLETAARHKVMLVIHEPIKATGLRRTFPNVMSREGARGQEYNAWAEDGGNPPDHTTILPFTRLLAGPMDFTPGIFDLHFNRHRPNNRVNTTLAKQLALYVVIYSPWQMAADLPENYNGNPAFQFIRDVPTDWSKSIAINGQIGDFVTIARKDRKSEDWYLGAVTDENGRSMNIDLGFLTDGVLYQATIYSDGHNADWIRNPYPVNISDKMLIKDDILHLQLAAGGGVAIKFKALNGSF
jgi:alpha-glucosidase